MDNLNKKEHPITGFLFGTLIHIAAFLMSGKSYFIHELDLFDTGYLPLFFPLVFIASMIFAATYSIKEKDFSFFKGFSVPTIISLYSFCIYTIIILLQNTTIVNSSAFELIIILSSIPGTFVFWFATHLYDIVDSIIYYYSDFDDWLSSAVFVIVTLTLTASYILAAVKVRNKEREYLNNSDSQSKINH